MKDADAKTPTILWVDPDNSVAAAFRSSHFKVVTAATGVDAIQRAKEGRPMALVMELRLDGKTTGMGLVEQLRQLGVDAPVVFVTRHAQEFTQDAITAAKAGAFFAKPAHARDLELALLRLTMS